MQRDPNAIRRAMHKHPVLLAGEGELHGLLKIVGLTQKEFCTLAGIAESTFVRWYGWPLHPLPIELLRYYAWTQNMAKFLSSKGWDPEKFRPQLPARARAGRYPRKSGDLDLSHIENKEEWSPYDAMK